LIKKLLARPYYLFLLVAILLYALSFLHLNGSIYFHTNDTYYILNGPTLYQRLAAFFLFFWLIYLFIYPSLYNNTLIWLHFILTILSIVAYYQYANYELTDLKYFKHYLLLGKILAGALFVVHLLYPINLIAGRIKHSRKQGNP
jgi:hypothetical protein